METDMLHSAAQCPVHHPRSGAYALSVRRRVHGSLARHSSGHRRRCRNGTAAAVHLQSRSADGVRAAAWPRRHHHHGGPDRRDPVRRARPRRIGGDDARRLSDDAARRGGPRARRLLHGRVDRRAIWRGADGGRAAGPAPDHSLHRIARTARRRRVRHFHGGGAVRQCAVARADRRLLRDDVGA